MLKIKLQRIGRKNDPSFRVVVTETTSGTTSQKHVDRVGFYNPKTKERKLDAEAIKKWISNGAQPSDTMHNMLIKAGIIEGKTRNVLPQKSPVVKEEEQKEEKKDDEQAVEETATEETENEEKAEEAPKEDAVEEVKKEETKEEASVEEEAAGKEEEKEEEKKPEEEPEKAGE